MSGEGGSGRKRPSAAGGNGAAGKRREPLSSHGPGAAAERHAVVAIDVGHHGTGWAYGWKGALDIHAFALNAQGSMSQKKEPTCVLLDERDRFVAFGEKARQRAIYAPGQDSKIKFFENFKMDLNRIQNIDPSAIPSIGADKQPVPVRTLFKVIFMEIVQKARKKLDESPGAPVRIEWVITHPIIWNHAALKLIRTAAEDAGMPSDRLQLLPEPDAAALWGTRDEPAVLYGRDMLVDNGGGTTDIVCYQKEPLRPTTRAQAAASKQPYHVAYFVKGKGGPYGAKFVDEEFEKQVLQPLFEDQYQLISPQAKHEAIQNFHLIKHSYDPRNPNDSSHLIPIRGILWDTKMDPAVLQTRIQQQDLRLELCQGYLKLQPELIEDLFSPVTSDIVRIIVDTLKEAKKQQKLPNRIILAGGFSESLFLQHKIQQAVEPKQLFPLNPEYHDQDYNQILVAEDPQLAVLKGAVLNGLRKGEIKFTRKARYTWGHDFDQELPDFKKDLPLYSAPAYVTEMKRRLSECEQYVTGRFQALVKEHDIISQDQRVKGNDFECLKDGKNSFCIFESSNPDAHFTSDPGVQPLGEIQLESQKGDTISIDICFGGDNITAIAYNKTRKKRTTTSFAHAFNEIFDEDNV